MTHSPGWDPGRRATLERLWDASSVTGGADIRLSDELVAERRAETKSREDDPLIVEVGGDLQAHRKVRPGQIRGSAGCSSLLLGPVPRRVAAVGRSPGRGGTAPRRQACRPLPSAAGCPRPSSAALRAWSRTISIMDSTRLVAVSYTHLRAHETRHDLVCRL